ncbi:MAG: rhodanese-like domain-containing protein [Hymenobacteraceae bacterium]|nr:rhodanese-like domain-containing protein [Hymenobacteraceae bacterium]
MTATDITSAELKARLAAGERPFILDVREPWEHEQQALPAATFNIPLNSLPGRLDEIADHQDDEIIVHCRSGARSATAKVFLQQQGYANVRNLTGGILGWEG